MEELQQVRSWLPGILIFCITVALSVFFIAIRSSSGFREKMIAARLKTHLTGETSAVSALSEKGEDMSRRDFVFASVQYIPTGVLIRDPTNRKVLSILFRRASSIVGLAATCVIIAIFGLAVLKVIPFAAPLVYDYIVAFEARGLLSVYAVEDAGLKPLDLHTAIFLHLNWASAVLSAVLVVNVFLLVFLWTARFLNIRDEIESIQMEQPDAKF